MAARDFSRDPPWWIRYGNAVLAVAVAILVRLSLNPILGHESPLLILTLAIMVAAYAGGFGPGLLATALSILLGAYLFVAPEHDLLRIDSANQIRLGTFLIVGTMISLLSEAIRRSRSRAEQTAAELARTNAHVSDILSSITDCYLTLDQEWRFIDINARAADYFGIRPEQCRGRVIWELFPQFNGTSSQAAMRLAVLTSQPVHLEVPSAVAAGRWAELHLYPRTGHLELYYRDITERKQAEEALRESERFARATVDAIPLNLAILDEHGTVLATNHAWREFARLRLANDGKIGVGVRYLEVCDAVRGPDAPLAAAFATGIRDVIAGKSQSFELEYPCHSPSEQMWFVGRVTRFAGDGPVRVVVAHENITARKQAELQLERARQSAEAANAAKDRFLAVLSHELRTPLTPVLATSSMLQNDPRLPDQARADMAMIGRNVALEARLIDDLLDLTRIARGKIELDLRPIDLLSMLRHTIQIVSGEITEKGLHLNVVLGQGPYILRADVSRLQQVFLNVIKNAAKFTPAGGSITVRCSDEPPGHVTTEIIDTGIGIDADAMSRIFDAFEQADPSVTRAFGGLGLGLAISKTLVDLHGGKLSAQSAGKGQGSTFRVQLPLYPAHLMPELAASPWSDRPTTAQPPTPIPGFRILLVEDHPDTSRVMTRLLSTLGHEVVTADSIAAAREKLGQSPFDLLLSDLGLPDGSGLDLMSQLQAHGQTIRGIALSGFGMESDVARSRQAGFVDHLTKPIDFDALQRAITRVMDTQPTSPA